jgi:hypothetical protein
MGGVSVGDERLNNGSVKNFALIQVFGSVSVPPANELRASKKVH